VSVRELLRALEEETRAEVRDALDRAAAERDRLVADAAARAGAEREAALAAARAEEARRGERERAVGATAAEARVLGEARRLLEGLRAEGAARLAARGEPAVTLRLLAGALADGEGDEAVEVLVDPAEVDEVREWLRRARPVTAVRARVTAADAPRGGVVVRFGDRLEVDETLASRLDRAWERLEPEVARALWGGSDGAL
jgi:vacuolar-type H+-ATPase subunit E/Vma4